MQSTNEYAFPDTSKLKQGAGCAVRATDANKLVRRPLEAFTVFTSFEIYRVLSEVARTSFEAFPIT